MSGPQEVKVTHGCGCGTAIAFLLVFGFIALAIEDIEKNPAPWIIGGLVVAAGSVAGWLWYQDQQRNGPVQPTETQAAPPTPTEPETKQCPECAETVKGAARVCRFCGYRFEGVAKSAIECPECGETFADLTGYTQHAETAHPN